MLEQITEQQLAENGVVSAPDKLEGDPKDNKAIFDRLITQLVARVVNEIIKAHNALDTSVNGRIDGLAEELRNHVDVNPGSISAENVALLRELADKYGLTDKAAPTVHDALGVLERWAKLQPETAERLRLPAGTVVLDEAIKALAQTELSSLTGGLKITAVYKTSGRYAENVYFRGLPDASDELLKTDKYGEFFAELPVGEYTLTFRPIIGEKQIPDCTVTVTAKAIAEVHIELEPSSELKHITESNYYLVGLDAAEHQLCAVGGGGGGGVSGADFGTYTPLAAGGGGGYVEEVAVDLEPLRGQLLIITVGAGAAAATASNYSNANAADGNDGGATMVARQDGVVILSAAGGMGGLGKTRHDSSETESAAGGTGGRPGVSVSVLATVSGKEAKEHAVFSTSGSGAVRAFGREDCPLVSGGGFAMCSVNGAVLCTSDVPVGCNEDGTANDGFGCGSGAYVRDDITLANASGRAGASGGVFVL